MNAIEVRQLTRRFGAFVAVNDLSFDVRQGEIFGFLGSNGAGKSTTIRMLCGLLRPSSGSARVGGIDVGSQPEAVKQRIGYMSQRFSLYEKLTVDQNITFFGGIYGLDRERLAARRAAVLEMAGLRGRESMLTGALSGGWRQRLGLGCAILHEPPIVFLDEPTGGVDPLSRRRFWRLINDLASSGTTVLVTTHYLDEAENCHRVAIIHAGRLAALGTVPELKQVFAGRPILEVRASQPVDAMRRLEAMPEVEKTSIFGTAVHAVMRSPDVRPDAVAAAPCGGRHCRNLQDCRALARGRVSRHRGERRRDMKAFAVAVKEFRQIARDRRTLMILLFVPAFFLLLYGYALNFDIRNIPLAVQDNDRSSASREVISAFVNSGYFELVQDAPRAADIDDVLNRGVARAVLVIPGGFGRDAATGRPTAVQVLISGDNANTATTVMAYAVGLVSALSARYEVQARVGSARGPLLTAETRVWYNPELRSTLFLVPGLIAYIAMLTAVVSTALSIVREKEVGTMEQVRMSPVGPLAYVIGKTMPYFVVSLASAIGIVALSMLLFDLPMRGSWGMLFLAISIFLVGALAFGVLISTLAETQQVAFQLALLTSYLPTLMLSGFIFPISSMPPVLQAITLRGSGALLSDRAARDRAQGRRPRRSSGGTSPRWSCSR